MPAEHAYERPGPVASLPSNVVAIDRLSERLGAFEAWRVGLVRTIDAYREYLEKHEDSEASDQLRLFELLDTLRADKLTIALVGEFSRGKTELINAIFFADYERRLLPSTPGRTTMSPTEILYEPNVDPCIRLLPIESRKSPLTIAELKRSSINWTTLPLPLDSAEELAETLQEIVRTRTMGMTEARSLGLVSATDAERMRENGQDAVKVPVWRHAQVFYPHPLLKKGLVLLDTPGLNALGAEPELTLSMLPSAHAVVFVVAADTGVTRSDLEIWRNHVCVATCNNPRARIVVLNKIDALWDELSEAQEVEASIAKQAAETGRVLDMAPEQVFPLSAHKGLVGKVRNDARLLTRSGLEPLERKLYGDVVAMKQRLLRDKIVGEIGSMVEASRGLVDGRVGHVRTELDDLTRMRREGARSIRDITARLRRQRDLYVSEVRSFQRTRERLTAEAKRLIAMVDLQTFDRGILDTRQTMQESWTTPGISRAMAVLFDTALESMSKVEKQSERIRELIDEIYDRFHEQHGLARMRPVRFSVSSYVQALNRLHSEAELYRTSARMLSTEQHFVIKRFFITLVSRARVVFQEANRAVRNWAKSVLTPIYLQIQEHRRMIEQRLDNLESLQHDQAGLGQRRATVEARLAEMLEHSAMIDDIIARLAEEPPMPPAVETGASSGSARRKHVTGNS